MAKKQKTDMIIVGGGMAGLTLASVVARQNPALKITVIDRDKPKDQLSEIFDGRTTAISYASSLILKQAGIWDDIMPHGQPITSIDVQDNHSPFILKFDAQDIGDQPFGWILENQLIRFSLQQQVRALKNITYKAPATVAEIDTTLEQASVTLRDGSIIQGNLIVGADGRFSVVREWANIDLVEIDYKQKATVCLVTHEQPHNGLAVERFMSDGPFAVLPFTDDKDGNHRSALVWTEHGKNMRNFNAVSEEVFNLELHRRFDDRYGAVELAGYRAQYPLKLYHAADLIGPRLALVGDAAHAIHPIAGQGLNLGMQDIAVLAELIKKETGDIGAPEVLQNYQRARRFDIFAMVAATDVLNRLFSNNILPIRALRNVGLGAVNRVPRLKKFFMRTAMGLHSRNNRDG